MSFVCDVQYKMQWSTEEKGKRRTEKSGNTQNQTWKSAKWISNMENQTCVNKEKTTLLHSKQSKKFCLQV